MEKVRSLGTKWSGDEAVLNWANPEEDDFGGTIFQGATPLLAAACKGHSNIVSFLASLPGIDLNKAASGGETALYGAAATGQKDVVAFLASLPGIDLSLSCDDGWNPISISSIRGHTEILEQLLALPGFDINKADSKGETAIYLAASEGNVDVVKLLIAQPGIDLNKSDSRGWSPLWAASSEGHTEVVRLLIAQPGIDVNKAETDSGNTPLHIAVLCERSKAARLLASHSDTDINTSNAEGSTALWEACSHDNIDMLKMLVNVPGIDLKRRTMTDGLLWALHIAANDEIKAILQEGIKNQELVKAETLRQKQEQEEMERVAAIAAAAEALRLKQEQERAAAIEAEAAALRQKQEQERAAALADAGRKIWDLASTGNKSALKKLVKLHPSKEALNWANPEHNNKTALHIACDNGHRVCVNLLARKPDVDVNQCDSDGVTPLHAAIEKGDVESVKCLLHEHSTVNVNIKTKGKQRTALHLASLLGHTAIVRELLARQELEVRAGDGEGLSGLHLACENGNVECAKLLLAKSDVSQCSNNGASPLYWACKFGQAACALLLFPLCDTALLNKATNKKRTPLHAASDNGHLACVKLLLSRLDIDVKLEDEDGETALDSAEASDFATPGILQALRQAASIHGKPVPLGTSIDVLREGQWKIVDYRSKGNKDDHHDVGLEMNQEVRLAGTGVHFLIGGFRSDGKYHLSYKSGDSMGTASIGHLCTSNWAEVQPTSVHVKELRRTVDIIADLKVGAAVEALYQKGNTWYAGKISQVHGDGSFGIDYDDGDKGEERVEQKLVRLG